MNNLLDIIKEKYEKQLTNYKLIEHIESIGSILEPGSPIIYISKKNYSIKKGYYQNCIQDCIMQLTKKNKKKCSIYVSQYFFFYATPKNTLKDLLKELVKTDFKAIRQNIQTNLIL